MPQDHTREEWSELLCLLPPATLVERAEAIGRDADVTVARAPETGSIVLQVREPIARQRFQLADMVVTTAEVAVDGTRGWAMRPGTDRRATLAQAVCEAEIARDGAHAAGLRDELLVAEIARAEEREAEWKRLAATIVEFEEVL